MEKHKLNSIALLIFFFFFCGFINAHSGYHSESHAKSWQLSENNKTFKADYIALIKDIVLLKDPKTGVVYEYPLTDFVMEDQFLILKRHELTAHINANLALPIPVKKGTSGLKMTKGNVNISLILLLLLVASLVLYWSSTNRKSFLTPALFSLLFLIFITCSVEEDPVPEVPAVVAPVTPPAPEENTDTDNTTDTSTETDNTTDTSTDDSTDTPTDTDNSTGDGTLLSTIQSHFAAYTGVSISADDDYFYIASYSWPEHNMGTGITAWQEQVPIPQNYQGDNSWAIPLNPEMADTPLSTSDHLLKGALAVAVNGVPIFNVFNNRGENSYELGELDNWGGHFGRGDDYHYHLIPTHLEDEIGTDTPLAYALDGYPVYGYTDETLDAAFGREDSNGNYRYHAKTTAPYYMPYMMGKVTLDPTSTAPEDQVIPQAIQNAVRPSDTFKGVNGAVVIGITETGKNAFSFEYEVSGTKYYVNYSWDENCNFTYVYNDEDGGTSNLPTNGSIDTGTGNVESFNNVNFCVDVSLGEGGSSSTNSDVDTVDSSDDSLIDTGDTGYSVVSENSEFTLSSIAIDSDGEILSDYQCEEKVNGSEKSIPISWSNVPEGTGSLAISIHAYTNSAVVETNSYLTLWDIDPSVTEIVYGGADDGDWYMGPNKDGVGISYTSPCNPNGNSSNYFMTIYALSETPSSLPSENSLTVDYDTLIEAIGTVTLIDSIEMEYVSSPSN
jgi:phosphatidylethanolamine-binding protein (PEBP) family uncharacterized protein